MLILTLSLIIYLLLGLLTLWVMSKRVSLKDEDAYAAIILLWPFGVMISIISELFRFLTWLGAKVVGR